MWYTCCTYYTSIMLVITLHVLEIDLHASSARETFCMLRYLFLKLYFCPVAFAMLVCLYIDHRVYYVRVHVGNVTAMLNVTPYILFPCNRLYAYLCTACAEKVLALWPSLMKTVHHRMRWINDTLSHTCTCMYTFPHSCTHTYATVRNVTLIYMRTYGTYCIYMYM